MKTLKKLSVLLVSAILLLSASCGTKGKKEVKEDSAPALSRMEVSISGMSCTGCEQTVQASVLKLEGVKSVKAAFTTGKAIVDYDSKATDTSMIRSAITATGYKVTGINPLAITSE
jgi:copper chaperone CopZ